MDPARSAKHLVPASERHLLPTGMAIANGRPASCCLKTLHSVEACRLHDVSGQSPLSVLLPGQIQQATHIVAPCLPAA